MAPSPALEARIRRLVARLDRFSPQLMRCHVTIDAPHKHQHKGGLFEVKIDLTVPDREIAIGRTHPASHAHEDPYVALRDTFRAARRILEDYERVRRGQVKHASADPRR
jgi:ubiquitin-protein ligase